VALSRDAAGARGSEPNRRAQGHQDFDETIYWRPLHHVDGAAGRRGARRAPLFTEAAFTSHNIRLDDGTCTRPGTGPTLDEHPWCISAKRLLDVVWPGRKDGLRLADLGCLEGGFAVEFARMGFQVVGIEVRESNIAACRVVKERTNLPNLSFVQDDAWNLGKHGPFDAVFCCGLLYHFDRPKQFLEMLSAATSRVLLLHTHFADARASLQPLLPRALRARLSPLLARLGGGGSVNTYLLSAMAVNEGLEGRWYTEFDRETRFRERERAKWASWDNRRSFWPRKEHLLQVLSDVGFDLVMEQHDALGPDIAESMRRGYYKQHDRGMFVGIKPPGASPARS
jgi:2-polyprenyl-3-methyl-5-hydroxy-6-metoxy-1,4-benzoquinol methylase